MRRQPSVAALLGLLFIKSIFALATPPLSTTRSLNVLAAIPKERQHSLRGPIASTYLFSTPPEKSVKLDASVKRGATPSALKVDEIIPKIASKLPTIASVFLQP